MVSDRLRIDPRRCRRAQQRMAVCLGFGSAPPCSLVCAHREKGAALIGAAARIAESLLQRARESQLRARWHRQSPPCSSRCSVPRQARVSSPVLLVALRAALPRFVTSRSSGVCGAIPLLCGVRGADHRKKGPRCQNAHCRAGDSQRRADNGRTIKMSKRREERRTTADSRAQQPAFRAGSAISDCSFAGYVVSTGTILKESADSQRYCVGERISSGESHNRDDFKVNGKLRIPRSGYSKLQHTVQSKYLPTIPLV